MTVLLVRHAIARARRNWDDDDQLRPLTSRGVRQADALVDALREESIDRIYSSPAVRCLETVSPLARRRDIKMRAVEVLTEGTGTAGAFLVDKAKHVLLCAHGDNLMDLLLTFAGHLDDMPRDPPFAKGAVWVLRRNDGKVVQASYMSPPR